MQEKHEITVKTRIKIKVANHIIHIAIRLWSFSKSRTSKYSLKNSWLKA
jgi:hypothetical protein